MSTNGKVYIDRLPSTTTDEKLNGLCGNLGKVKSARVIILFDKTTREERGFGLVEMESPGDNHKVIAALHGSKLDESILCCFSISHSVNAGK
ncbi:MAG: RNA-binding protein [Nitrospirae bacterium]|nr:RNA-binding protein [Nitrospirota bacterium]